VATAAPFAPPTPAMANPRAVSARYSIHAPPFRTGTWTGWPPSAAAAMTVVLTRLQRRPGLVRIVQTEPAELLVWGFVAQGEGPPARRALAVLQGLTLAEACEALAELDRDGFVPPAEPQTFVSQLGPEDWRDRLRLNGQRSL
jgi:hypothetical protein